MEVTCYQFMYKVLCTMCCCSYFGQGANGGHSHFIFIVILFEMEVEPIMYGVELNGHQLIAQLTRGNCKVKWRKFRVSMQKRDDALRLCDMQNFLKFYFMRPLVEMRELKLFPLNCTHLAQCSFVSHCWGKYISNGRRKKV